MISAFISSVVISFSWPYTGGELLDIHSNAAAAYIPLAAIAN